MSLDSFAGLQPVFAVLQPRNSRYLVSIMIQQEFLERSDSANTLIDNTGASSMVVAFYPSKQPQLY